MYEACHTSDRAVCLGQVESESFVEIALQTPIDPL